MFVFLQLVTHLQEVKYFIDFFKYFLVGSKERIVGIYFSSRLIKIACAYKTVAFIFVLLYALNNANLNVCPLYFSSKEFIFKMFPFDLDIFSLLTVTKPLCSQ